MVFLKALNIWIQDDKSFSRYHEKAVSTTTDNTIT